MDGNNLRPPSRVPMFHQVSSLGKLARFHNKMVHQEKVHNNHQQMNKMEMDLKSVELDELDFFYSDLRIVTPKSHSLQMYHNNGKLQNKLLQILHKQGYKIHNL